MSFVEARRKEVRLDGIDIKEAQEKYCCLSTGPEPVVGQLWRIHKCHRLFRGGLKYVSGNVLKICFQGL